MRALLKYFNFDFCRRAESHQLVEIGQTTPLCINADISRDSLIDKKLIKGKVKAMKYPFQNIAPLIIRNV